jgi:hypothetical protein
METVKNIKYKVYNYIKDQAHFKLNKEFGPGVHIIRDKHTTFRWIGNLVQNQVQEEIENPVHNQVQEEIENQVREQIFHII